MSFSVASIPDAEWQKIMERLWTKYGVRSTGNKTLDKLKLHELELKEAEALGEIANSCNFITITKDELEKILRKKKVKKEQVKNKVKQKDEITKSAEILGKQIFLAIQMKSDDDFAEFRKKLANKYQS